MKNYKRNRRKLYLFIAFSVIVVLFFLYGHALLGSHTVFYFNLSLSEPQGVYLKTDSRLETGLTVGDLILLRPPQCLRPVMRLFGINVADTLIKNILAGPGDTVFVDAKSFCINGIRFGALQENVSAAFINAGCLDLPYDHVLSADEYFVGSAYEESVDSRYFGPMTRSEILGKAKLVLKF